MNEYHASDPEIQQYSFDKTECEISIVNHIENCERCKAEAKGYSMIIDVVKKSAAPVFDFDLSGMVLSKLSPATSKPKVSWLCLLPYIICTVLTGLLFIAFFRRQQSGNISPGGINPMIYYIITVAAMGLAVYEGIDMYKRFRNKVNRLNLY